MKSAGILLLREIPPPSLHEIYASIQGDGTNYPSFSFLFLLVVLEQTLFHQRG